MSSRYGGRWHWPPQECDHRPERRVAGSDVHGPHGELERRIPEYCRDCGLTFAPPPATPAEET